MEWFLTSESASKLLLELGIDAGKEVETEATPSTSHSDGLQLGATVDSLLSAEKEQQVSMLHL